MYCVRMYPGIQGEVMKTAIGLVISGVLLLAGLRGDGAARAQDSCSIAYNCHAGLGCTVDPTFIRTVEEMAAALGLPDANYRPCKLIIDTNAGRYIVPYPMLYLCWDYRPICGVTARDYAMVWRNGDNVRIESVQVWLERHIPNYLPIAVEGGEWTEQGIKRGNIILPIGIAYPPPEDYPEPPYP